MYFQLFQYWIFELDYKTNLRRNKYEYQMILGVTLIFLKQLTTENDMVNVTFDFIIKTFMYKYTVVNTPPLYFNFNTTVT